MDLGVKIKEAFKKSKSIREARWNYDTQPNIYELDNFLRKSGYRLVDLLDHDSKDIPELIIEPIKKNYLHPEIVHDMNDEKFYINVIEYGNLELSDVEGIIKGYENALGVLRHLESLPLEELEIGNRED